MKKAIIHYTRVNRPVQIYTENLLRDDGLRLDTRSDPDPAAAQGWCRSAWWPAGLLREDQLIATVLKHHFYQEWFGVMELRDASGGLLGFYCDVLTPLEQRGGEYYLNDLLLDLWIPAAGPIRELDWDEFQVAVETGRLSKALQEKTAATLQRMAEEARAGVFPWKYIEA